MPRKLLLGAAWIAATLVSMFIVTAAIGVVRDQVTTRPSPLPAVLAAARAPQAEAVDTMGPTSPPETRGTTRPAPVSTDRVAPDPTTIAPAPDEPAPVTTLQSNASSTSAPAPSTTSPPATSQTTTTTSPPATAMPTTTTSPPFEYATYQLVGGWVRLAVRPGEVVLDGAGAAPGYVADVAEVGPHRVVVEFEGQSHESELDARWDGTELVVEVDESPESD